MIRSGEARLVGWSRHMLYSGFNFLPRSICRSANSIARSDNADVVPLARMSTALNHMDKQHIYGFGNLLYWDGDTNCQMSWIPPLPPSKLIWCSGEVRFKNTVSSYSLELNTIQVLRTHTKWITSFVFLGQTGSRGYRLAFAPISSKNLFSVIRKHLPDLVVDPIFTWHDPHEIDDRKRFDLPERPSG